MNAQQTLETKPRRAIVFGTLFLLTVLYAVVLPLAAQDEASPDEMIEEPSAAIDEEAAHDALRVLRKIYEQAIRENNLELLQPHLDTEVSGIMVTSDLVIGFDGLKAYWNDIQELMGEGGVYTTTLVPELTWIHGDIAVAQGSSEDHVVTGAGKEYDFTSNWTAVLVHREGGWKIRRMQGTMNPVENQFVAAAVQGAATWAGVGAGIGGLVIGLVVGIFWSKSRARLMAASS